MLKAHDPLQLLIILQTVNFAVQEETIRHDATIFCEHNMR